MNLTWKVIGAATGAVLLFFASAAVTGHFLDQQTPNGPPPKAASRNALATPLQPTRNVTARQEQAAAPTPAPTPAREPLVIKRILPIDGPIRYGEWHWDEDGVPPGKLVVTVDLEARVISVFRGGYEIGAAAVLLGTDDHPTPLGVHPILQKRRHNVSSIYGAEMPYTLRLTWDGISIHGAEVENGYASHGCVGTPNAFAAKLFEAAKPGDEVIITRGATADIGSQL